MKKRKAIKSETSADEVEALCKLVLMINQDNNIGTSFILLQEAILTIANSYIKPDTKWSDGEWITMSRDDEFEVIFKRRSDADIAQQKEEDAKAETIERAAKKADL